VVVTANSLLEKDKVKQNYEVTKHCKFQTAEKRGLKTKCGNWGRGVNTAWRFDSMGNKKKIKYF